MSLCLIAITQDVNMYRYAFDMHICIPGIFMYARIYLYTY